MACSRSPPQCCISTRSRGHPSFVAFSSIWLCASSALLRGGGLCAASFTGGCHLPFLERCAGPQSSPTRQQVWGDNNGRLAQPADFGSVSNTAVCSYATASVGREAGIDERPKDAFDPRWAHLINELSDDTIVEMLPERTQKAVSSDPPLRQSLFMSPLIPLIYERILPPVWAAGLRVGGMDEEFEEASEFLGGDGSGIIADVSCGTGFIARRLAASGKFAHVIALDYSREMLGECVSEIRREKQQRKRPEKEGGGRSSSFSVVRGDAGALPFRDASLDAVHWGAAMHCVPDAEAAMHEMHRVLRPGGKLYATTFLHPLPDVVFRFFDLEELEKIALGAGFGHDGRGEAKAERLGPVYGVLKATK